MLGKILEVIAKCVTEIEEMIEEEDESEQAKESSILMSIRKTRSDCTVGTFEKKRCLPPGTIRNRNGRDTRSDKLIGTIRKEAEKRRFK